jgi:hypothetical protein
MDAEQPSQRRRQGVALVSLGLVALLVAGTVLFQATAPRRAVLRLAPAERAELFARTRAEAEALCARHEAVFEEECARRLELLRVFPECQADCQRFVAGHEARPAR